MVKQIVLTALEGALVGALDDGLPDALEYVKPAVSQLMALGVPVVVFTQRDRVELEPIRAQLGLTSPFITESGSAIFTSVDHNPFEPALGERDGHYFVEMLGCPYVQARAGLRVIANVISHPLKGFGDFTVPQMQRVAKLSETAAHQAKAREFSEPFMTPKAVEPEVLRQAAEEMGFRLVLRSPEESRFSELLGADAGLGEAVKRLVLAYQRQGGAGDTIEVIGLCSQPAALTTLATTISQIENAKWTPIQLVGLSAQTDWLKAVEPLLASA